MNLDQELELHKNNKELVDCIQYLKNECESNPDSKQKLEIAKKTISGGLEYLCDYAFKNRDKYQVVGGNGCYVEPLEGVKIILDYLIEDGIEPCGIDKPTPKVGTRKATENKAPRNDLNLKNEQEVKIEPKVAKKAQKQPKTKQVQSFTLFDL